MQLSLDAAMEHTFSVGEFCRLLDEVLSHSFPHDVWVQGEVRGIKRAQSGHVYFDLVDTAPEPGRSPDAVLPVVLFEATRRTVNQQIKRSGGGMRIDDGIAVRIRAVPDFYAPQGKLSLRMTGIDPAYTLGQLAASRDRLLRLLASEGLLEANAATSMPELPLTVGLITARGSAAEADFIDELRRSAVAFSVVIATTPVQGAGAARRIAAAITACARTAVDVIAVVRGGGARTDLAAFDDEAVARAIAGCPVPVITGIGHEIDTSIADAVAHSAFKTPTACAAHVVDLAIAAERAAADTWGAIARRATERLQHHDLALVGAAARTSDRVADILSAADNRAVAAAHQVRSRASTVLGRADDRLRTHGVAAATRGRFQLRSASATTARSGERLDREARRLLADAAITIDRAEERARLLDPARALARGWSITTDETGRVIRSVDAAPAGGRLTIRVADGRIVSTVEEATPDAEGTST